MLLLNASLAPLLPCNPSDFGLFIVWLLSASIVFLRIYYPLHALLCVSITSTKQASLGGTIKLSEVMLQCSHIK